MARIMARIIVARPFFVLALSVFTLLLLWQDMNARGHYLPDRHTPTKGPETAPPVAQPAEAPADAVPEAESAAETMPEAEVVPDAEPGKGTMTLDGETRSLVANACHMGTLLQPPQVNGDAKDNAGYTLNFKFMPGLESLQVSRTMPEVSSTTYRHSERNRAKPAVYHVDGTTVTLDAKFEIAAISGKSSAFIPSTKHSVQLSFDCFG
jgi:hypothetical protein